MVEERTYGDRAKMAEEKWKGPRHVQASVSEPRTEGEASADSAMCHRLHDWIFNVRSSEV